MQGAAVPVFLIHRVVDTPLLRGTSPAVLDEILSTLSAAGCRFVGLDEVVAAVIDPTRRLPTSAVCFTADDGYDDQAEVLAPLFESHRCPLTIFLTTGFLDGTTVGWWDRLEHAMTETCRSDVEDPSGPGRLPLTSVDERRQALYVHLARFGELPSDEAEAMVERVLGAVEVEAPSVPFGPYQPMTWEAARAVEARGIVRFGPHTVTHPLLARTEAGRAEAEIDRSWSRLGDELSRPLPVFCYPVGEDGDYGSRDAIAVERRGLDGAVTVGRRHVVAADLARQPLGRYRIPRLPITDPADAVLATAGALRVRHRLRDRDLPLLGGRRPTREW